MKNEVKSTPLEKLGYGLKYTLAIAIAILAICALCFIFINITTYFAPPLQPMFDQERLGQLGDFLGGTLNPIFGFATVCLLLWSVFIQRQELSLTRIELSKSSTALQNQLKQNQDNSARHQLTDILNREYERYETLLSARFKHVDGQGKLIHRTLLGFETFKEIVNHDVGLDFSDRLNDEFRNFNPLENPIEEYKKDIGAAFLTMIKIQQGISSIDRVTREMLNICDVESVETYWFMRFYDAMQECKTAGIISERTYEETINSFQTLRKIFNQNHFGEGNPADQSTIY